jgi:hypothetical protein
LALLKLNSCLAGGEILANYSNLPDVRFYKDSFRNCFTLIASMFNGDYQASF